MEWMKSLRLAIEYMEDHMLEEIEMGILAEQIYMSPFYFQKGFKIMTGYSVSEYIRGRRLYLAALDMMKGNEKVIDIAYKYQYDSPESFAKAFKRFHGVSPMQVVGEAQKIKPFLPLKIIVQIQGGNEMNYVVEKMDAMQVIGMECEVLYETAYQEIPKFWNEFQAICTGKKGSEAKRKAIQDNQIGEFGICISDEADDKKFRYMAAGVYKGGEIPEGMKLFEIPATEWAKFACVGPMPGALQTINTQIFREWLPNNPEYEMSMGINIEWYAKGDMASNSYESAIWMPIKKK